MQRALKDPPRTALLDNIDLWRPWDTFFRLIAKLMPKMATYTPALTPGSVAANSESVQTFALPGISPNDVVKLNKPTNTAGLDVIGAWCEVADNLRIKYRNYTGAPIVPPAETYRVETTRL